MMQLLICIFNYMKKRINISEIIELKARLYEINSLDLCDVNFIDEFGNAIKITNEMYNDWKHTGLSNTDFIIMEFYKNY